MFKLNAKFDADSLLYSLILNVTATQYTYSFNGIYRGPPLTSTVKSSLFTDVHSRPLSLAASYIDITQTILLILTMSGLYQKDLIY